MIIQCGVTMAVPADVFQGLTPADQKALAAQAGLPYLKINPLDLDLDVVTRGIAGLVFFISILALLSALLSLVWYNRIL